MTRIGYLGALSFAAIAMLFGCGDDRPSYAGDLGVGGTVNNFGGSSGVAGSFGGTAGVTNGGGGNSGEEDAGAEEEDAGDVPPSSTGGHGGTGGSGGTGGQGGIGGAGGAGGAGGTGGQGGSGGQPTMTSPLVGSWSNPDSAVGCAEIHMFGGIADNNGNKPYTVTYASGKHVEGLYKYTATTPRGTLATVFTSDNLQPDCAGSSLTQVPSPKTRYVELDQSMQDMLIYNSMGDATPVLHLVKQP